MKSLRKSFGTRIAAVGLAASLALAHAPVAFAQTAHFTNDLTVGSSGAQVSALQTFLISKGYAIPSGATGYFGAQTKAALASFQSANGITPAVGYFGPVTRAKANAAGTVSTPAPDTNSGSSSALKGGEASLERYDLGNGDDAEVQEGASASIADISFRVEDGDIRLNRMDITLTPDSGNGEKKPWKAFDRITLLANGKEIASKDASREKDWVRSKDPYVLRFSNLSEIFREGKTVDITVEIEAQNGVVDANATDTWTLSVADEGIRAVDSEGLQQYAGDASETIAFDVVEAGAGEALKVRSSTDDPDSSTLAVETGRRSDWYTVLAFELEAEKGAIELTDLPIDFTTASASVRNVVDSVRVSVDGKKFDKYTWNGSGTFASTTIDIDGKYTVKEDDRVPVVVEVRFKAANGANYAEGETLRASVAGATITGEGADDVSATGNATGEMHTLSSAGLSVSLTKADTERNTDASPDAGTFWVTMKVTAFGDDIYVSATSSSETANFSTIGDDTGISYDVTGTTASASILDSSADRIGDSFVIREGKTETITFTVAADGANAFSQLILGALQYGTSADDNQAKTLRLDASKFKTSTIYLSTN